MLSRFEDSEIKACGGDCYKSFVANEQEIEIYFPHRDGVIDEEYFQKCRRLLEKITELDNLVQYSCEEEYAKSSFHVRDFMLYLAMIEIGEEEVALRYFGQIVNTEWDAIFKEQGNGNWVKVNF